MKNDDDKIIKELSYLYDKVRYEILEKPIDSLIKIMNESLKKKNEEKVK